MYTHTNTFKVDPFYKTIDLLYALTSCMHINFFFEISSTFDKYFYNFLMTLVHQFSELKFHLHSFDFALKKKINQKNLKINIFFPFSLFVCEKGHVYFYFLFYVSKHSKKLFIFEFKKHFIFSFQRVNTGLYRLNAKRATKKKQKNLNDFYELKYTTTSRTIVCSFAGRCDASILCTAKRAIATNKRALTIIQHQFHSFFFVFSFYLMSICSFFCCMHTYACMHTCMYV